MEYLFYLKRKLQEMWSGGDILGSRTYSAIVGAAQYNPFQIC